MTTTRVPVLRLQAMLAMLAVLAITLAVSGCGRRGGLEPPPSASVVSTDEQGNVVNADDDADDRSFILDPLIK